MAKNKKIKGMPLNVLIPFVHSLIKPDDKLLNKMFNDIINELGPVYQSSSLPKKPKNTRK